MNNSLYEQKMQKNVRVFGWFVLILISTFIAGWIYLACHEGRDQPSVEEQLNDTLFKEHSEIPQPVDEDSIVKYGTKSLWMYHGPNVVAIRPNKT